MELKRPLAPNETIEKGVHVAPNFFAWFEPITTVNTTTARPVWRP